MQKFQSIAELIARKSQPGTEEFAKMVIDKFQLTHAEPKKVGEKWVIACSADFWQQNEIDEFCSLFGVSAHKARHCYIIANLHQPYQPRHKFA